MNPFPIFIPLLKNKKKNKHKKEKNKKQKTPKLKPPPPTKLHTKQPRSHL